MAAAFADDLPEIRLAVAMLINELLVAPRLLDGIEVSALDVFDNRQFQRGTMGSFAGGGEILR